MRLKIIITLILGIITNTAFAQSSDEGTEKFMSGMLRDVDTYREHFKDSVAHYTMNVTAAVNCEGIYSVKIQSNDSLLLNRMTKLNHYLKNFNYKTLLGSKTKAIFTLPVSIRILPSKKTTLPLDDDLERKISRLFYRSKENSDTQVIYLPALIVAIDMKLYH